MNLQGSAGVRRTLASPITRERSVWLGRRRQARRKRRIPLEQRLLVRGGNERRRLIEDNRQAPLHFLSVGRPDQLRTPRPQAGESVTRAQVQICIRLLLSLTQCAEPCSLQLRQP